MLKQDKDIFLTEDWTVETKVISLQERQSPLNEGAKSPASLILLKGPQEFIGFYWPLTKDVTVVGRSQKLSDIVIPHLSMSKNHFQIMKKGEEFHIHDLHSKNHTSLNCKRLAPYKPRKVTDNSQIQAGLVTFKFLPQGHVEFSAVRKMLNKIHVDHLTTAANRHALDKKGPEYFKQEKSLSLVIFDVDNFKAVNDTYGHPAGDFVLQTLSHLVRSLIRERDMLFRFGGDEFCIFLPGAKDLSLQIAERIRSVVEKRRFVYEGQRIPVTISLGLAFRTVEDKSWKDLYKKADKAFYAAKQGGKNKVHVLSFPLTG